MQLQHDEYVLDDDEFPSTRRLSSQLPESSTNHLPCVVVCVPSIVPFGVLGYDNVAQWKGLRWRLDSWEEERTCESSPARLATCLSDANLN